MPKPTHITKFTNCNLITSNTLLPNQDLWIDSVSGKILQDQHAFYEFHLSPDVVIDLGGRILAPGFIEAQLNGAHGFDFSVPARTREQYEEGLAVVNKELVKSGVTAYLPTVVSSEAGVYSNILPSLAPKPQNTPRRAEDGAESLGAHVEGPFISPKRNGVHKQDVLRVANGLEDIIDCYGRENIIARNDPDTGAAAATVKMISAAPEIGTMMKSIPSLTNQGIIFSIGHSDASYEQSLRAVQHGATMITHLFNAMRPFYHRNPGIFGLLGQSEQIRPYYGIIADGIHLHPTSVKIAYNAHPTGLILVTDAMKLCGLPDGVYDWTNGDRIVKDGSRLTLEGSEDKIAGSSATLVECVNNFWRWTGGSVVEAVEAVTGTPARMLGLDGVKGCLESGADADLVVLRERLDEFEGACLTVDQVWKFGVKVFDREDSAV